MLFRSTACLTAIAAAPGVRAQQMASLPDIVTNGPQFTPGDRADLTAAERNVRDSVRYEVLLRSSPAFRWHRMHKECGPISDPQLYGSCLASFNNTGYPPGMFRQ